jgi:predicted aspartyl protease
MKKVLALLCILTATTSNVKSQTEGEFETIIRQMMEEECKTTSISDEALKAYNITEECYWKAYVEAWMQELIKRDLYNIKLRDWFKLREDMDDEHSTFYNELMHTFSIQLEKMCKGYASSISVNGPQKGIVSLTKYGAMYRIKITTGNSSKYFIIDTGADNSFITKSYARELEDMNLIQPKDYIEAAEYQDAHGNTVLHKRVLLNDVKIGDFTLNNVIFAIGNNDDGGFLLGKDILNAFRSWNINNSNSTLELIK